MLVDARVDPSNASLPLFLSGVVDESDNRSESWCTDENGRERPDTATIRLIKRDELIQSANEREKQREREGDLTSTIGKDSRS